ncbi:hypothetical protein MAP00_001591 [Monascus purpureus]|nr:hypothetical protein MAP00_001591 [Monascus purpureus]
MPIDEPDFLSTFQPFTAARLTNSQRVSYLNVFFFFFFLTSASEHIIIIRFSRLSFFQPVYTPAIALFNIFTTSSYLFSFYCIQLEKKSAKFNIIMPDIEARGRTKKKSLQIERKEV